MKHLNFKNHLTPAEKARLKLRDPKPTLALYRVAHEGISTGAVVGMGKTPKTWTADRVDDLRENINSTKVPVYIGHPNGRANRSPVGYVLKAYTNSEGDNTEAMAIVHFTDTRAAAMAEEGKLDAASIEADLGLQSSNDGWLVAEVERVTGLALEDRTSHTPGFRRAGLVAITHELDDDPSSPQPDDPARSPSEALPSPPAPGVHRTIEGELEGKNLSPQEREFIHNRVRARDGENRTEEELKTMVMNSLADLEEAKRIYRQPPPRVNVPAQRDRGPADYTKPEHNDLIPR